MDRTSETHMTYWQQGDCLIKPVSIPNSAMVIKTNVLIEGEHTGHAHRVTSGEYEILREANTIFLRAITSLKVTHEEHKPHVIPPGEYFIDVVREVDPFTDAIRRVQD